MRMGWRVAALLADTISQPVVAISSNLARAYSARFPRIIDRAIFSELQVSDEDPHRTARLDHL